MVWLLASQGALRDRWALNLNAAGVDAELFGLRFVDDDDLYARDEPA